MARLFQAVHETFACRFRGTEIEVDEYVAHGKGLVVKMFSDDLGASWEKFCYRCLSMKRVFVFGAVNSIDCPQCVTKVIE